MESRVGIRRVVELMEYGVDHGLGGAWASGVQGGFQQRRQDAAAPRSNAIRHRQFTQTRQHAQTSLVLVEREREEEFRNEARQEDEGG